LLDEESFKAGFGLQTPIVNGPLKVVRYYPYFNRCFGMLKKLLAKQSDTKYNEVPKFDQGRDFSRSMKTFLI
jgi:hypothetical protein